MSANTAWKTQILNQITAIDERECQREKAYLAKTAALTAKSQEMWDSVTSKLAHQCKEFNVRLQAERFHFETISSFRVRVSLVPRPSYVNVVFKPALNKWTACDSQGNKRTFEVRLPDGNEPALFEILESDDYDEPRYLARFERQAVEAIIEMLTNKGSL